MFFFFVEILGISHFFAMFFFFLHMTKFSFPGKHLLCHPGNKPVDLKVLCTKLRAGPAANQHAAQKEGLSDKENEAFISWANIPDSAYDLLKKLLDMNPFTRITADQALQHEFFSSSQSWDPCVARQHSLAHQHPQSESTQDIARRRWHHRRLCLTFNTFIEPIPQQCSATFLECNNLC